VVIGHPPYSPDLTPSDFHFFGPLNKHLAGNELATGTNMKQAVTSWLQIFDTDFFCAGIKALLLWGDKYSAVTMWQSDVYHLLCMGHVCISNGINPSALVCLLAYSLELLVHDEH
jgi:hypothetical protein